MMFLVGSVVCDYISRSVGGTHRPETKIMYMVEMAANYPFVVQYNLLALTKVNMKFSMTTEE